MLAEDGLPRPARYRAIAVLILAIGLSSLDGSIVNLALPAIARDLHSSAAQSVWVINAYQIAILALLLPLASLGDRIGHRKIYLGGVALFTAASLGCILADTLPQLAAARALQGAGAAGIMAVNLALVRLIYPKRRLGRGIAINSMVVATSSVAGPSVAAGILSVASWPWLFVLNLPLGVVVVWLGLRALPQNTEARSSGAKLSWFDVLLNALMFSLLFLGTDALGVGRTATSSAVAEGVAMLLAGLVVGVVYVRRQLTQPLPLFPLDLLRIPMFALSIAASATAFAAQTLAYIALPFLMLDGYGRSPLQAGALITAWPLATFVVAPLAARLIGRYPDGLLGGIGLATMAAGLALLAALPVQPSNADIVWRMALCGIGFGLFQSPNNHTMMTTAPPHRSGGAAGMLGTARLTGQSLGAMTMAIIFSFANAHDGRGPVIALALAACLAVVAGAFSTARVRHRTAGD